ncbi:MAG: hypothetical protein M3R59_02710 [Verrucomicrobiota bacterium]|nr:hypothetical protein [Verrucomicrobiota bacterium]
MIRSRAALTAIASGFVVTLAQLAIAILLLAPEGPLGWRYQTLIEHDSYWFGDIVNRGYATTVPPAPHKMIEVSNTAFFPAYPAAAALLHYGLGFTTENAMLLAAQLAAWGFWTYFFLLCARWQIGAAPRYFGALLIAAHPAAFYLIAAYSESLFLMSLLGFLYWMNAGTRGGKILAALHGIVMTGTRIVGLPCALAPIAQRLWERGWRGIKQTRSWMRNYAGPILLSASAMIGGLAFFLFCQLRWGRWDIYMLTQESGWAIDPDYLAVFKFESYRLSLPSLDNPTEASQLAVTIGALMFIVVGIAEFLPAIRRQTTRSVRVAIYFAAWVLFYISVSGVACVAMESMLRYEFCVHALLVLAFLHYLHNVPVRSRLVRASAVMAAVLISAVGLALECWYVWNFTRGNWVA